ncbi:sulfotransferase [Microbulbifer sp. SSSA002]|uniref:sulfotransferase n=1 Tax=Microbulbifer sp. SSSA002 TaxID=3243376 RepID=UPI004039252B
MKVFQIGFNKCGTTSLSHFFLRNGYKSVHWDYGNLALKIEENFKSGRLLLEGYEQYNFYGDMEMVSSRYIYAFEKYYKQLDHQYPGSFFILNNRPIERWVESRKRHGNGTYLERFKKIYRCNEEEVIRRWEYEWYRHHSNVLKYFYGRDNFLLFNIETDSGEKLIDFIGEPDLKASYYRHTNKTEDQ